MIRTILILSCILLVTGYSCKEKYNSDYKYPNTGYLVVEGFINSGKGATSIRLSRTVRLVDSARRFEQGALVTVEGDDNSRYVLTGQTGGMYINSQLNLDRSKKFRLHIKTTNGREYFSDFATPIATPPIDSISLRREAPGAVFYINTHDPQNKTWYYTWNYEETWEINSRYFPSLKYVIGTDGQISGVTFINPPPGPPDTTKFRCWQYQNSTSILIGSSIKLSKDLINLPLSSIEFGSPKIAVLYSIKVFQHAVSAAGYDFLSRMKKNTQQVGSIFDAQPSELNSNVRSVSDPSETVIGFVEVADAQELRIFVDPRLVTLWAYNPGCEEKMVTNNRDSLRKYSYLYPVEFRLNDLGMNDVFSASPHCVDCTLSGSNIKPSYWPR